MFKLVFPRSFSCTRVASAGSQGPRAGLVVGPPCIWLTQLWLVVCSHVPGFEQRAKAVASLAPSLTAWVDFEVTPSLTARTSSAIG